MWIVSKESLDPILGIRLFKYVRENIKHRYLLHGQNKNLIYKIGINWSIKSIP